MGYKIKGRVTVLTPTKSMTAKSGNAYQSRYLVITAIRYDQYTGQPTEDQENTPKFTFFGKQCEALDNIKIGDIVTVNFDIQGRAFDKDGQRDYFTEVRPFRVDCDNSNEISPTQLQNNSGNQYPNFYAPGCAAYPRPDMGYSQQQISENNQGSQQYAQASHQAPQAYQPPIQPNSTPFGQSTFPPDPTEIQGKTEELPF